MKDIQVINGVAVYKLNGKTHRTDGPAFVGRFNVLPWYLFGHAHRYYGPAQAQGLGSSDGIWYIHGRKIK